MKGDPKKLAALSRVADAAWAMEQAKMAALAAEETALRRKLDSLDQSRRARASDLSAGPDAARLAGMDPLWERWVDGRRSALAAELARLKARQEEARLRFGRAYGRKETVAKLHQRLRDEVRARKDQP